MNMIVRWKEEEVTFEAGPKHVEAMLKDMRLAECKASVVPGVCMDGERSASGSRGSACLRTDW